MKAGGALSDHFLGCRFPAARYSRVSFYRYIAPRQASGLTMRRGFSSTARPSRRWTARLPANSAPPRPPYPLGNPPCVPPVPARRRALPPSPQRLTVGGSRARAGNGGPIARTLGGLDGCPSRAVALRVGPHKRPGKFTFLQQLRVFFPIRNEDVGRAGGAAFAAIDVMKF
jgi:hypothetical protein